AEVGVAVDALMDFGFFFISEWHGESLLHGFGCCYECFYFTALSHCAASYEHYAIGVWDKNPGSMRC
ncbi:MAG: hypothetical protein KAJ92_03875, partial [Gammaproteobacteria bacterium]|nr:hypothetical protein [Gammaproteobacteria bacterium]